MDGVIHSFDPLNVKSLSVPPQVMGLTAYRNKPVLSRPFTFLAAGVSASCPALPRDAWDGKLV